MICSKCGAAVGAGARFCAVCGAALEAPAGGVPPAQPGMPPPAPPMGYAPLPMRSRLQNHLRTLGILWVILGVYRLLGWMFALPFMGGFFGGMGRGWGHGMMYGPFGHGDVPFNHSWMATLIPMITLMVVLMAGFSFLVGYALLTHQSWGRILAIIAAVLTLLKFPLGTALAIYTLWVLLPADSAAEYERIAP